MIRKFIKWFLSLFSAKFVSPEVNQKLASAVNDKLKKRQIEFEEAKQIHDKVLKDYIRTYFDREYESNQDMSLAFETINRKWKKYVKEVNSGNKIISLNKNSFKTGCESFITMIKIKEQAAINQTNPIKP